MLRKLLMVAVTFASVQAPVAARADCDGTDLRTTLTQAEQARIEEKLAATPYAQGNHWVATRGDQRIDLIGTYHFNAPQFDAIAERLEPVVATADAILFEVNAQDTADFQKSLATDLSAVLIVEGPTLPDLMTEDGWDQLSALGRERGIPAFVLAKSRPVMLLGALALPGCFEKGPDLEKGLDKRLMQIASHHNVPQISLETVADSFGIFEQDPLEEQAALLEKMLPQLSDAENQFHTLLTGYLDEDVARTVLTIEASTRRSAPDTAEHDAVSAKFNKRALTDRNHNWMPVILRQPGDRLVIAVGAAHLSGKDGLLHLLEQQGYTLERAAF